MNPRAQKTDRAPKRRRYVVYLFCAHEQSIDVCRYMARIEPWVTRHSVRIEPHERSFADEWELIEIINPLLPKSSDVRDVLSHVECPEGFLYLLHPSSEERRV
jgi:hypothetical protein